MSDGEGANQIGPVHEGLGRGQAGRAQGRSQGEPEAGAVMAARFVQWEAPAGTFVRLDTETKEIRSREGRPWPGVRKVDPPAGAGQSDGSPSRWRSRPMLFR